jgi:glycine/D-amino acid oxidase-like deaminating enzyme
MGTIGARRVVCAAGYESDQFLDRPAGTLHSTYALASEPLASQAGWPERCLIWETARPYFYARQSEDGRAIIGGGDTIFSTDHQRDNLLERKVVQLAARFRKLFPAIELTPEFAWGEHSARPPMDWLTLAKRQAIRGCTLPSAMGAMASRSA